MSWTFTIIQHLIGTEVRLKIQEAYRARMEIVQCSPGEGVSSAQIRAPGLQALHALHQLIEFRLGDAILLLRLLNARPRM